MYLAAMSSTCFLTSALNCRLCRVALGCRQAVVEHAAVVFQRKLGIDAHRAGRLGQDQHAVDARAALQGVLEGIGVGRQAVAHQRFQLNLAEGAARALVAQHFLQRHDVGRQAVDLLLRLVDHRQPRHHRGEGLVGFLEAFVEPLGHLAGDLIEPAIDRLRQLLHALVEVRGHAFQRVLQQALARRVPARSAFPASRSGTGRTGR